MYSVLAWREPCKNAMVERRQVGPISVQWAWVHRSGHTPGWLLRRRVKRAVAYLQAKGITQGVVPADMEAVGIEPISTVALREHLAITQLGWQLEGKGVAPQQATVAVVAERLSLVQEQIVEQLALAHRHVVLQARGADGLCQRLRRQYGVAIQCNGQSAQLRHCDGVIAFAPVTGVEAITTYDQNRPLPPLHWPSSWDKPPEVSPLEAWAMVANTERWQDNWAKLALIHRELEIPKIYLDNVDESLYNTIL